MMQLLRNYKYEYGTVDNTPWYMSKLSNYTTHYTLWYFSTYSWRVQIEREIDPAMTWDSWKITEVPIRYSITKN